MTPATKPSPTDFLTTLRGLTPQRPLSPSEAKRIAELQAARLLREAGFDEPAVDVDALGALLHVMVASRAGLPITSQRHWVPLASRSNALIAATAQPERTRLEGADDLTEVGSG